MTRNEYLAKLDAFMLNVGADVTEGRILGFERHEEALSVLIRHRSLLDHDAPRKHPVGVVDALEAIERGASDLRAAYRNGSKAT
jgi:hypothetical protein